MNPWSIRESRVDYTEYREYRARQSFSIRIKQQTHSRPRSNRENRVKNQTRWKARPPCRLELNSLECLAGRRYNFATDTHTHIHVCFKWDRRGQRSRLFSFVLRGKSTDVYRVYSKDSARFEASRRPRICTICHARSNADPPRIECRTSYQIEFR